MDSLKNYVREVHCALDYVIFENIYSDKHDIEYDNIHHNHKIAPPRKIKPMSKKFLNLLFL